MSRNNFQISVKRFRARNLDTGNGRSISSQGGTQKAQWGTLKFYGEPRSANRGTANAFKGNWKACGGTLNEFGITWKTNCCNWK